MHVQAPDRETEVRDQMQFDQAVDRQGRRVLEVLAGVGIVGALLMSIVALNKSSEHNTITVTSGVAAPPPSSAGAATAAAPAKAVSLSVIASSKLGPARTNQGTFTTT